MIVKSGLEKAFLGLFGQYSLLILTQHKIELAGKVERQRQLTRMENQNMMLATKLAKSDEKVAKTTELLEKAQKALENEKIEKEEMKKSSENEMKQLRENFEQKIEKKTKENGNLIDESMRKSVRVSFSCFLIFDTVLNPNKETPKLR